MGLLFLVFLAGLLNIYNLWNLGYGNSYYAAAIKSMTQSLSNFFFISFDSVGFISIDKAPLSLWLDAVFAKIFGFNGFIILLPHALAGIAVTILTYVIVKKVAGSIPAFVASLVITLSPVNVAVYRNNTPDALLLVFVLLAIYFVIQFFDQKRTLFLILSAVMIGLGFNTKMSQAFLILPAIAGTLFIFAEGNLLNKTKTVLLYLFVAALVSISWITIVDLTPADMRPYMGGSENNSAWNLVLGYNGAQRLLGEDGIGGRNGFNVGGKGLHRLFVGEMGTQTGWLLVSALLYSAYFALCHYKKLFQKLLGKDVSFSTFDILVVINIGFLIVQYLFFSFASFFHSYYLNIFAVPIAFLIGGLVFEIQNKQPKHRLLSLMLLASAPVQIYLIRQTGYATWLIPLIIGLGVIWLGLIFFKKNKRLILTGGIALASLFITPLIWSGYTTLYSNTATAIFIGGPQVRGPGPAGPGGPGGPGGGPRNRNRNGQPPIAGGFAQDDNNNGPPPTRDGFVQDGNSAGQPPIANYLAQDNNRAGQLPVDEENTRSYPSGGRSPGGGPFGQVNANTEILAYLKQNYNGEKYFVAVGSQQQATEFILNEDVGNIMTLGGFSGRDQTLTLEEFREKIASGELRFFLDNGRGDRGNMPGGGPNPPAGNRFSTTPPGGGEVPTLPDERGRNNPGGGGGMFNANQDITDWVRENAEAVEGRAGLYDLRTADLSGS
jgi:4-amino-4-deoxy-L-arabinose transferase-like glycosyltransferase